MKIIIDKIPEKPSECLFSASLNLMHPDDIYVCNYDGQICKVNECECPYLKPISDYIAEKPAIYHTDRTGKNILCLESRELFNLIDNKEKL